VHQAANGTFDGTIGIQAIWGPREGIGLLRGRARWRFDRMYLGAELSVAYSALEIGATLGRW
jgi:hypothetical protein